MKKESLNICIKPYTDRFEDFLFLNYVSTIENRPRPKGLYIYYCLIYQLNPLCAL